MDMHGKSQVNPCLLIELSHLCFILICYQLFFIAFNTFPLTLPKAMPTWALRTVSGPHGGGGGPHVQAPPHPGLAAGARVSIGSSQ